MTVKELMNAVGMCPPENETMSRYHHNTVNIAAAIMLTNLTIAKLRHDGRAFPGNRNINNAMIAYLEEVSRDMQRITKEAAARGDCGYRPERGGE